MAVWGEGKGVEAWRGLDKATSVLAVSVWQVRGRTTPACRSTQVRHFIQNPINPSTKIPVFSFRGLQLFTLHSATVVSIPMSTQYRNVDRERRW